MLLLWRTRTDGIREAAGTRQSAIILHTLAYQLGFLRNMHLRLQSDTINGVSSPTVRDDYFLRCKQSEDALVAKANGSSP
jgi:hypothetical protein